MERRTTAFVAPPPRAAPSGWRPSDRPGSRPLAAPARFRVLRIAPLSRWRDSLESRSKHQSASTGSRAWFSSAATQLGPSLPLAWLSGTLPGALGTPGSRSELERWTRQRLVTGARLRCAAEVALKRPPRAVAGFVATGRMHCDPSGKGRDRLRICPLGHYSRSARVTRERSGARLLSSRWARPRPRGEDAVTGG